MYTRRIVYDRLVNNPESEGQRKLLSALVLLTPQQEKCLGRERC